MGRQKLVLVDTMPFAYQLTESPSGGSGLMKVKGVFQRADVTNLNERVYPRALWEKLLGSKNLKEALSQRRMLGEVDHPAGGEMKLKEASHVITRLEMKPDGTVIGEAEILNTESGRHLQELFRAGIIPGISSRGSGSTLEENGVEIVQEDFKLDTFDFVAVPSTPGAYPTIVNENAKQGKEKMTVDQKFKGLREAAHKVINQKVRYLSQVDRNRFLDEAESLTVQLSRLVSEDAGYSALANELITKLAEQRKELSSPNAPPTVEKQITAAGLVINEMVRQMKERDKNYKGKLSTLSESITKLQKLKAVPMSKYEALQNKLNAASVLGDVAVVKLYVESLLKDNKNAHLRPIKSVLENSKTKDEVDSLVEQLSKLSKQRVYESRELPVPGSFGTRARLIEESQSRDRNYSADIAKSINKKLGHRF